MPPNERIRTCCFCFVSETSTSCSTRTPGGCLPARPDDDGVQCHCHGNLPARLTPSPFTVAICDQVEDQPSKTFTKTFEIDVAIRWQLYKKSLTDELLDRAADAADCPQKIVQSAWTGEVQVKDNQFVVTLTEGEKE